MANKKAKKQAKGKKKGNAGKGKPQQYPVRRPAVPVPRLLSSVTPKRSVRMGHMHATCSMSDPFCVHARNAQRLDGGPPTIPFQIRSLVDITTATTSGGTRYVFIPGVLWNYQVPASVGADWNMAATYTTALDALSLVRSAKEVRIVSFGVIVRCFLSANNAQGRLLTSVTPNPFVLEAVPVGQMSQAEVQVSNVAAGLEMAWISKPMGPTAHNFRPLSAFTNTMTDFDWTSLAVEIGGTGLIAAPTVVLTAEYVCNIEMTIAPSNNGGGSLTRPAPPPNRVATAAAAHISATVPSFVQGGIDTVAKKVESYAASALDSIISEGMALLFA